ncbi:PPE family protein [Mycobacterium paragordonae]|uniref:PPE domain-containing protein n=1 Tax=Mycobacterium paragordonae TaxID=1389713 RepID=A0AAJ1W6E0_9MYCO|nr:PPE family protein [Mycobacterium paragordonae]MDP7739321.1 PPE domain-containing protein [Mycobacterium paragordonae]TDK94620.1 PPE domain-containing protein [Mycobacterium paragordonae]TDL04088.1 PPE domain-containing protein [Mycobacterium paragordonae]
MDFGIYPPEINSGRMYTGPGPGPMLAAAQAWGSVADELYATVTGFASAVAELTEGAWSGPSSAAMSAAAQRYVQWLSATAAHAEETAVQARTAAAAFEAAFAATVPPPEVAANRALLAVLVASNFLGQNTPAIAATEAVYAQMWAQDTLAMYTYAGSSAAAVVLSPFRSPQQSADPGAAANPAATVGHTGTFAGTALDPISVVPQALSAAAAPAPAETLSLLASVSSILFIAPSDISGLAVLVPTDLLTTFGDFPASAFNTLSGLIDDDTVSGWDGKASWPDTGSAPVQPFRATLPALPTGRFPAPTISATLGQAHAVGGLSVPSSWTPAAPEVRTAAFTTSLTADPSQIAAALAGQATAGPPAVGSTPNGTRATPARPAGSAAGTPAQADVDVSPAPRTVMTGVAAAIRDIARQRAEGQLSEHDYAEHKKRLLAISGGHRPLA